MSKFAAMVFDEFEGMEVGRDVYSTVIRSLEPAPHTYSGKHEKLETHVEKVAQFTSSLFTHLLTKGLISPEEATAILAEEGVTFKRIDE